LEPETRRYATSLYTIPNMPSEEGSSSGSAFSTAAAPKNVRDDADSARLCNKWVNNGLSSNKSIQFLVGHLVEMGCMPPDNFIQCRKCENPQASGFGKVIGEVPATTTDTAPPPPSSIKKKGGDCQNTIRDFKSAIQLSEETGRQLQVQPEIFVCEQYMENETMTHKSLVHELIHAIDLCRTKMDPINNCLHLACTEVRAENLSGECGVFRELPRIHNFLGHGGECVKRRAVLSVRANPNCAARAQEYVDAAMPRCFQDNYPFERHPNQL